MLGLSEPTDEEKYQNDPVALAALPFRSGAPLTDAYPNRTPAVARSEDDPEKPAPLPQQLTLGMPSDFVQNLWGQPQEVETAGTATSGNQRWIYFNGLSNRYGTSDYRVVYFEKGQVVGWENHR